MPASYSGGLHEGGKLTIKMVIVAGKDVKSLNNKERKRIQPIPMKIKSQ